MWWRQTPNDHDRKHSQLVHQISDVFMCSVYVVLQCSMVDWVNIRHSEHAVLHPAKVCWRIWSKHDEYHLTYSIVRGTFENRKTSSSNCHSQILHNLVARQKRPAQFWQVLLIWGCSHIPQNERGVMYRAQRERKEKSWGSIMII